jgi:hypothetical protein
MKKMLKEKPAHLYMQIAPIEERIAACSVS